MTYKAFLIKYAEIAIKGKNRYLFEDALVSQMNHALKKVDGTFHIRKEQGRIYVEMEGEYDYDGAVEALQHVFGIVGICPVVLLEDEGFDALAGEVIRYIDEVVERIRHNRQRVHSGTDQQLCRKQQNVAADSHDA